MSWSAGAITGTLGMDIGEYAHGMVEAQSIAQMFPGIVQAFLADPLLGAIDLFKELATGAFESISGIAANLKKLGNEAASLGVAANFLRQMGAVAEESGGSVDGFAQSLRFLERNQAEVLRGNAELAMEFARVGVSVRELQTLSPEELFRRTADGIKALGTAGDKTASAMALLGRGSGDMVAMLDQGSAGIAKMIEENAKLRPGLSALAQEGGIAFADLEHAVSQAWGGITDAFAQPILEWVSQHFEELKATITEVAAVGRDFAAFLGEGLAPALSVIVPIVKAVAEYLKFMLSLFHAVEDFTGLKLSAMVLSPPLGLLSVGAQMLGGSGGGGGNAAGGGHGAAPAGGGASGGINVHVSQPFDPNDSATRIAGKLRPALLQIQREGERRLEGAAGADRVRNNLDR